MKMKRIASCLIATAVTSIAIGAAAQAQIIISDFDDGTTSGWAATDGGILTSTTHDNTIHATSGDYALSVFQAPPGAFHWALQLDNSDIPNLQNLIVANPIIVADVSWTTSEWDGADPGEDWVRWDNASINSDAGWMQTSDADMSDSANPSFPGSWDASNWGDSHQRTISWDFSSYIAGNEAAIENSGFFQLNLSVNYSDAFTTGGSFWIDTIRLEPIPEPASLALLGLGSALMLGRRRR